MTLAYRHAFHAGNHADVLKHVVLMQVLARLTGKDKPLRLVDTHAGAGGYSLEGRYARKHAESTDGIGRLWRLAEMPGVVAEYVELVRRFNPDGELRQYPGSPLIAQALLRPIDRLSVFEAHPTEQKILRAALAGDRRVSVHDGDGFAGLRGQLPPPSRRGAVLIDPSYEGRADYGRVVATLRDALARFADGVYLVWYPQVSKLEAQELPRRLRALTARPWLDARLTVQAAGTAGYGLTGSGMFVINPPHRLRDELADLLPWLARQLGQPGVARHLLEHSSA